jgi:hypothetical protein
VTNYGAIAILAALPDGAGERQLRVLVAVETFKADSEGWRPAGQILLAKTANVSVSTLQRARRRLIEAKLITYRAGSGRGQLSRYRIDIADLKRKSPSDHLSDKSKGGHLPGQKVVTDKPGKPSVPAGHPSQNGQHAPNPALSAKAEALSSPRASTADTIRAAYPDATGAEIETITQTIKTRHQPRNLAAYITALAANGTLRLPCDRDGPGKHTEACRNGDSAACGMDWCGCRCHLGPHKPAEHQSGTSTSAAREGIPCPRHARTRFGVRPGCPNCQPARTGDIAEESA